MWQRYTAYNSTRSFDIAVNQRRYTRLSLNGRQKVRRREEGGGETQSEFDFSSIDKCLPIYRAVCQTLNRASNEIRILYATMRNVYEKSRMKREYRRICWHVTFIVQYTQYGYLSSHIGC